MQLSNTFCIQSPTYQIFIKKFPEIPLLSTLGPLCYDKGTMERKRDRWTACVDYDETNLALMMDVGQRTDLSEFELNTLKRASKLWALNKITGCWLWYKAHPTSTYGQFSIRSKSPRAHRAMYELLVAEIPEGLVIDHLCKNHLCVNPHHLEAVTNKVNVLRGESPPAKNARKTHCHRGHEFTEENTYICPKGHRHCRACQRSKYTLKYPLVQARVNGLKTHCLRGHEFTEENTKLESNGYRHCKACIKFRNQRNRKPVPKQAHCKHGHEFTEENTYIAPTGSRVCRICAAKRAKKAGDKRREARRAHRAANLLPEKTHCRHGHEWTEKNTYVSPNGVKNCKACERVRTARRREARQAAKAKLNSN